MQIEFDEKKPSRGEHETERYEIEKIEREIRRRGAQRHCPINPLEETTLGVVKGLPALVDRRGMSELGRTSSEKWPTTRSSSMPVSIDGPVSV